MKIEIENIKINIKDKNNKIIQGIELDNITDKVLCRGVFNIIHARSGVATKKQIENSGIDTLTPEEYIKIEKTILLSEMQTEDYSYRSRAAELEELLKIAKYEYYKLEQTCARLGEKLEGARFR